MNKIILMVVAVLTFLIPQVGSAAYDSFFGIGTTYYNGLTWRYRVLGNTDSDTTPARVGAGQSTSKSDWRAIPKATIGDISIPSQLDGRTIIGLYDYAFQDCAGITSVIIPSTVTSLGAKTFTGCSSLATVYIPNSVTKIVCYVLTGNGFCYTAFPDCENIKNVTIPPRFQFSEIFPGCYTTIEKVAMPGGEPSICNNAFAGCSGLREVDIASDVTAIGSGAFKNCSSLSSLQFPNGLTTIGGEVISGCSGLTTITIPDSVTSISAGAFGGCANLREICLAPKFQLSQIMSVDCAGITNVVLSTGYDYIGSGEIANCTGLRSFSIPEHIVSIKDNAFNGCSGLSDIRIPDTVENLGVGSFMNCSGLTNVALSASVKVIPQNLLKSCSALKRIEIPEGVTEISEGAFDGCGQLCDVRFPNSLKKIGANAFRNCIGLTELVIPDSVTEISPSAFAGCSMLVSIEIPSRFAVSSLFPNSYTTLKSVVFTDCEASIIDGALSGCSAVTSVLIPNTVTNIGSSAFRGCLALESVCLPLGLLELGDAAFENCLKLKEVAIPTGVVTIPSGCFRNCGSIDSVELPYCLCSIGDDAFKNCSSIRSLSFPCSVSEISESAFVGCVGVTSVRIPANFVLAEVLPDCYDSLESVEFPLETTEITADALAGCANLLSLTIPSGVSQVGSGAFSSCVSLQAIEIPNGITNIASRMFVGCTNLKTVVLPESITSIGFSAFEDCSALTAITLPATLKELGDKAFCGCDALEGITVPGMVRHIGRAAFGGCASLESIVLEEGVASVGSGAFEGCNSLQSLSLPSTIVSLGDACFRELVTCWQPNQNGFWIEAGWVLAYENNQVSSLAVPEVVKGIAPGAFADYENLEQVSFPSTLKYIGVGAFRNDACLDNLIIPDAVEYVDDEAFMNCTFLRQLQLGNGLKRIGDRAFYHCSQLTTLDIPDGVNEVGSQSFYYCWRMLSIKLPLDLVDVGTNMFERCSSLIGMSVPSERFTIKDLAPDHLSKLTSVVVLEGSVSVCSNAFANCTALTSAIIPSGVTNIGDQAFMNCSLLAEIAIPDGVQGIGVRAFSGCTKLGGIVLPDTVSSIGSYVFNGCGSLTSVTLSRNLQKIPDYAFWNCSSLLSMVVPASIKFLGSNIGNRFSALYFMGNAPQCDTQSYGSMPSAMKTYVVQGTKGWDGIPASRDLPESWNARAITTWEPIRFDVTFDAAGGCFPGGANTYACEEITDTGYVLPPFEPTRAGYKFAGWWTDSSSGAQVKALTKVNETRPITFYAHWTFSKVPMTVRFHANGGTVSPDERTYFVGATYETFPVPTREHYIFDGWYSSAIGGVLKSVSDEVPAADEEMFAHWTPETYKIRYNPNGGSGTMADQSFLYGSSVTLVGNSFIKHGCNFIGWGLDAAGPVVYANNKTISSMTAIQGGIVNLYAIWTAASYAVRFDSNGGTGSMTNDTFKADVGQALTSNAYERVGYVFIGWSKTANGAVEYEDGEVVCNVSDISTASVTLFAVWAKNTSNVSYLSGGNKTWRPARETKDNAVIWQSGAIGNCQDSYIEVHVHGGGTIAFDWRSSCEGSFRGMRLDYGAFYIDGEEKKFLNDDSGWLSESYTITGAGEHILKWVYRKDLEGSEHDDCLRLANVVWTPSLQTLSEFANVTNLTLETSGDADWLGDTTVSHDMIASVKSGEITDGKCSVLSAQIIGTGVLRFYWKVSCEETFRGIPLDYLECVVDGVQYAWIAGEHDWEQKNIVIGNAGAHVVQWRYVKDDWADTSAGLDCAWIDEIEWIPDNVDPIPDIGDAPSAQDVHDALDGSADDNLVAKITNGAEYKAYREWAATVKDRHGTAVAGQQAVKDSPNAWLSFALHTDKLIGVAPKDGDLKINDFVPASEAGKFDMTVELTGVEVGTAATAENLKQVFGLEGSSTLDADSFSPSNVAIEFGTPVGGKVKCTVVPVDKTAGSFFMKMKLK